MILLQCNVLLGHLGHRYSCILIQLSICTVHQSRPTKTTSKIQHPRDEPYIMLDSYFFHTLLLSDKDTFHFPTFQCPLLGRR